MNLKLLASATFCIAIVGMTYLLLFSDSNDLSQETASKGAKSKASVSSNNPSRDLMPLPTRSSSKHGADCAHCIAKKESGQETSPSSPKPVDHGILPAAFDMALVSDTKDGEDFRYISTSSDIFSQISEADIGDTVVIELSEGLSVEGILKSFKDYQPADSAIAGMVELPDHNAQLSFFSSDTRTKASILFKEKSVALEFNPNDSTFVETLISDMFCSGKDAVFPLNHPSNLGTGYLSKK